MVSKKKKTIIYGVDITKRVTPIMVRDAMIQCFYEAHSNILELAKDFFGDPNRKKFEKMKKLHVKELIENIFDKIGENFNNPTKESLIQVVDYLKKMQKFTENQILLKNMSVKLHN